MAFYLANPLGLSISNPLVDEMWDALAAIDPNDEEHGAAWLADDEERGLEMNGNGVLVWDSPGQPPRHMVGIKARRAFELWVKLARGLLAEIESEPWQPGSRPRLTSEEEAELVAKLGRLQLEQDRAFYDLLGTERLDISCRRPGCSRGAIHQSLFCRVHHFESVRQKPCPFVD